MNDPAALSDVHAPMNLSMEAQLVPQGIDLERRVQRLEDEINVLKDTKALEERVALRVTEQMQKAAASEQFTAALPARAIPPARDTFPSREEIPAARGSYAWLLFDMVDDARLMFRMLLDKRYILAWTTHLVVWPSIFAILTSRWWFPIGWIPVVGIFFDKALDLVLGFCVYKALSREVRRYREMLVHRR
ncbi:MAG TPA: hypothetical protein VNX28_05390 [Gemmataceae bacterium]|jgi:hypothetical protein|nr:hypothetical protein [Gemmataceae bacterium]